MNQEFNIVDFPREIIEHIFSFINDTQGYGSFRLTCLYIYYCSDKMLHFYPSGKLRLKVPIVKHKINGHVLGYHINEGLKYVGLFLNNDREGIHRYFYSDNKLMYTGNYCNNDKIGYHYWYHCNGSLERFNRYIKNKKQDKEIVYHPSGSFKSIIKYFDNQPTGVCEFFKDSFDNIKYIEIPVKNGRVNGLIVLYNYNGFIQYQGYIKDGYPIGTHRTYFNNGRIKMVTEFKNGQLHGYQKEFYSNGSLKSIVRYRNNLKDSRENTWHNKNGLKTSVRYSKNKKNGYSMKYNFFGNLDKKSYFEEDKITGLTEIYSKSGKQFQSLNNNNDILINLIDGKLSTVFFRNGDKKVCNNYSYFIDGKIKNKTYNDGFIKGNIHYNILGEVLSETFISQNFVKCLKYPLNTENIEVNTCVNIADKMLMIPL